MAKIAAIADWWWPDTVGGAELTARQTLKTLADSGHEVVVFTPGPTSSTLDDSVRVERIFCRTPRQTYQASGAVKSADLLVAWLAPRQRSPLLDAVVEFGPEVIVLHNVARFGQIPAAHLKARIPDAKIVHVHHDLSDACWRRSMYKRGETCASVCITCRPKAYLQSRAHVSVDSCVAVSEYVRSTLVEARVMRPERSSVGYPLGGEGPPAAPTQSAAADDAVDASLRVGFIGRILDVKGLNRLIEALAIAQQDGVAITLVVAGEGDPALVARYVRLASALGVHMSMLGHLAVSDFADCVDVCVVPSQWPEPFGRVPVELAIHGVPTIVTPVGGLPEAARIAGGLSCVASGRDSKALAEAILRFTRLGNRRNAIGDNEMSEVPLLTEVLLHEIGRLTEGLATRNESGHSAPLDDSRPERT
ncbi:unannotated protein [freshwater metagenome]|uniref:Unannotated protein n=1 Tax=freshwater metagenome TaxID=449393 RepID=A0A6J7SBP9_9ZZZZ|nr:glycosyltransferase [Actinomycetota bacterium]MSW37572.1 glycosyltransferase [Actinomycetota bacterium]